MNFIPSPFGSCNWIVMIDVGRWKYYVHVWGFKFRVQFYSRFTVSMYTFVFSPGQGETFNFTYQSCTIIMWSWITEMHFTKSTMNLLANCCVDTKWWWSLELLKTVFHVKSEQHKEDLVWTSLSKSSATRPLLTVSLTVYPSRLLFTVQMWNGHKLKGQY